MDEQVRGNDDEEVSRLAALPGLTGELQLFKTKNAVRGKKHLMKGKSHALLLAAFVFYREFDWIEDDLFLRQHQQLLLLPLCLVDEVTKERLLRESTIEHLREVRKHLRLRHRR